MMAAITNRRRVSFFMIFSLSNCLIFSVVFAAKILALIFIKGKELSPLRWFFGIGAAMNLVTICVSGIAVAYWDARWYSEQIELVLLAVLAGYACTLPEPRTAKSRLLQLLWAPMPALGIFFLSLNFSPLNSLPAEMHVYRMAAGAIIVATVIIGSLGLLKEKAHRMFAAAAGVMGIPALVGSGWPVLIGATPNTFFAPCLWLAALGGILLILRSGAAASSGQRPFEIAGP